MLLLCCRSTGSWKRITESLFSNFDAGWGRVVDSAMQTMLEVVSSIAILACLAAMAVVLRSVTALCRTPRPIRRTRGGEVSS